MRAPSLHSVLASAALVAVGAGCNSSRTVTTDGGRTAEMRLQLPMEYGRPNSMGAVNVTASAESVCLTTDCATRGIRLTFSNASRQSTQLRMVPVVIHAGTRSYTVPATDLPRDQQVMPSGRFLSTLLRGDFADAIADDRDVRVTFGGTELTFPHDVRGPLRRLLATMREQTPMAPPPETPRGR